MIPQETVNLILDTVRIEDVVGDFVTLKRRGANLVACCPFHNEKTPSFYVSPAKGIYKCFGCGKSGSAVGFIMEHEHVQYAEALKYLAAKYHIEVVEKEESAEDVIARQRRESLLLVSEFAQKFFVESLQTREGKSLGLEYYHSRGLLDETIQKYGLGWAPSGRTALVDAATAAGYKTEYLVDAGLAIQTEDGRVIDKFNERVMFPIHSLSGRVIAYSGRTLRSDNPAKYVNSPETELYKKSKELLGIYHAKAEISRQDKCYLVEGNLDVISMHQLGITNVVASCGTSLTVEQIRLIKHFTDNLTIMYDGDAAGIHAAVRGIDMVLAEGMNVRVVFLPDGDDPDSFSRKHSLQEFSDFIASHETDFISFKADLLLQQAAGDPIRKAELINDIADSIAKVPDAVKRSVYAEACAEKFGIESKIIFNRVNRTRSNERAEAKRIAEREAMRQNSDQELPPPPSEEYIYEDSDVPAAAPSVLFENPVLEPVERELLRFLLQNGSDELVFETDSDFYMEGHTFTVAEFIRSALDEQVFENLIYKNLYDAFMAEYDAGLDNATITKHILDGPDRSLSQIAGEISIEKYDITVQRFSAALTTTSSWLAKYVPQMILRYAERRIYDRMDKTKRLLSEAGEMESAYLEELVALQKTHRVLVEKLGQER